MEAIRFLAVHGTYSPKAWAFCLGALGFSPLLLIKGKTMGANLGRAISIMTNEGASAEHLTCLMRAVRKRSTSSALQVEPCYIYLVALPLYISIKPEF